MNSATPTRMSTAYDCSSSGFLAGASAASAAFIGNEGWPLYLPSQTSPSYHACPTFGFTIGGSCDLVHSTEGSTCAKCSVGGNLPRALNWLSGMFSCRVTTSRPGL